MKVEMFAAVLVDPSGRTLLKCATERMRTKAISTWTGCGYGSVEVVTVDVIERRKRAA